MLVFFQIINVFQINYYNTKLLAHCPIMGAHYPIIPCQLKVTEDSET